MPRTSPCFQKKGDATWYTARKGRRAANGQVFSNRALTAAHRTLPMGSLIVVTNLENGQSAAMRISDRGPFAPDKVIDLTIASAKATGVYRMGVARVRIDVYRTPKPIDEGGRWCVQIGAFKSQRKAEKLKAQLLRKYPGSHVIDFAGEHTLLGAHPAGRRQPRSGRVNCAACASVAGGCVSDAAGLRPGAVPSQAVSGCVFRANGHTVNPIC